MRVFNLLVAVLVMVAAFLFSGGTVDAQVRKIFDVKTFAHTTSRIDTSATVTLTNHDYIELGTWIVGTDSLKLGIYVDYLVGTVWRVASRDTIFVGTGLGGVKASSRVLRAPATNLFPGATAIRVRNQFLLQFRTADSTAPTSYTQYLFYRRP